MLTQKLSFAHDRAPHASRYLQHWIPTPMNLNCLVRPPSLPTVPAPGHPGLRPELLLGLLLGLLLVLLWSGNSIAQVNPASGDAGETLRQELREDVREWASAALGLPPDAVYVAPLDRRTRLPLCEVGRLFDFPFSSRTTVRIVCPETDWRMFVRIEIRAAIPVVFLRRDLPAGHVLSREDVELQPRSGSSEGFAVALEDVIGRSLRRAMRTQEPLPSNVLDDTVQAWRLVESAREGQPLQGLVERIAVPLRELPTNAVVGMELDRDAQSTQFLSAGRILLHSDLVSLRKVLVARRLLPVGTRLTEDAVVTEALDQRQIPHDALFSAVGLSDLENHRLLRAGEPIRSSDLRPAVLVRRGQTVTILLRRGTLEVASQARATQDGRIGEWISLVNTESGRELRGQVTGVGEVLLVQ